MSVTVVILRRARPGEGPRLLEAACRLFAQRFAADPALRAARILQQIDDPERFLLAGDWTSREAYWCGLDRFPSHAEIDALSAEPPRRLFFQRVTIAEDASRQPEVVRAVMLELPDDSAGRQIALRRGLLPRLRQRPGFVFQHLLQDLDDPRRLLFVYGWTGEHEMLAGHRAIREWLGAAYPGPETLVLTFQGRARLRLSRLPAALVG
ncbi:MAG TPA: hypothetical protein VKZ60_11580 [Chloroflexota bacterium]|nr:hypothetical protein [Chloroflexota bacterium]